MYSLFWVAGVSLVISWSRRCISRPGWAKLLRSARQRGTAARAYDRRLLHDRALVSWCIRWRRTVVAITFGASGQCRQLRLHSEAVLSDVQSIGNPRRSMVPGRLSFKETGE